MIYNKSEEKRNREVNSKATKHKIAMNVNNILIIIITF